MIEIETEIDRLYAAKQLTQKEIVKPSRFGKWPSDKEFMALIPLLKDLEKIQAKIDTLEDVLQTINTNRFTTRP